jgi:integrase
VPAIGAGEAAARHYVEFYAAEIRNPNTRAAYARAASDFFGWCGLHGLVQPLHVKVRGPKHSAAKGRTRMPTRDEAKALLAATPTDNLVGLRDRALIGTLLYTFARVSAATAMRVGDYYPVGKRWWVRLHEKGGRHHQMPCHHRLAEWLDAYIEAAGIGGDRRGPLFRTAEGRTGRLTEQAMAQPEVYRMIGRCAEVVGVATQICCHSWRARGITAYLENGGRLDHAQAMAMAGHASARTTKIYDRRGEQV